MSDVAAGASVLAGLMGFKGNMAAAKNAEAVGEYNARLAENEAIVLQRAKVDEDRTLRRNASRLIAQQRTATAASGIEIAGSPLQALADAYFNTELDAARIKYASSIEQVQKESEAALARTEGAARGSAFRTAAVGSLLSGAQQASILEG